MTSDISTHYEKAKSELKATHDSMVQKIKEDLANSRRKAMSKI
jgi:ribosomal protein L17